MTSKKSTLIVAIILFLFSSGLSYTVFSFTSSASLQTNTVPSPTEMVDVSDEFANQPKTEECPLNGKLYPKSQRLLWEKRRPLGIMVQNNKEARMQSGLSAADVIYEAVAEGGITRFLAIYYCENPKIVGSVRSARVYYITLLQGYGNYPLYAHVGGANTPGPADALGKISQLGWSGYNDLNQFSVPFPVFWRDYERLPNRATEHTVYTDTNKLWQYAAEKRNLTNIDEEGNSWDEDFEKWRFIDEAKDLERGKVNYISFGFWEQFSSDYSVLWEYERKTNSYKRINGGEPHIDKNTGKQLIAKNIIIIFADESVANDGYEGGQHLLYDLIGRGNVIVFQNGQVITGVWTKPKATDQFKFFNDRGDELAIVRGKVWVEILPTGNKVSHGELLKEITPPKTTKPKNITPNFVED